MSIPRGRSPEKRGRVENFFEYTPATVLANPKEVSVAAIQISGARHMRGDKVMIEPQLPQPGDIFTRQFGKGILKFLVSAEITTVTDTTITGQLIPSRFWSAETTGRIEHDPDTGLTAFHVATSMKPPTGLLDRFSIRASRTSFQEVLEAQIMTNRGDGVQQVLQEHEAI